jgi:exodeoxyribonuclease VII small subunit
MAKSAAIPPPAASDAPALGDFETAMAELEKIVSSMEAGQLTLEASLEHYRRGAQLLTWCQGRLQAVQDQVRVLEDGLLKDFTLDATGARLRPGQRPDTDGGGDARDTHGNLDDDDADADEDSDCTGQGDPAGRSRRGLR